MTAVLIALLSCQPSAPQTVAHWLTSQRHMPAAEAKAVANQIVYCANLTELDPFVLAALIDVETGETWRQSTKGRAGERSVCQFLRSTARSCGYDWGRICRDRDYAILCGAYYLAGQKGSIREKLCRYNGGPAGPRKARCRRYAETVLRKAKRMR